jgi:hypothetical protein
MAGVEGISEDFSSDAFAAAAGSAADRAGGLRTSSQKAELELAADNPI